MVIDDNGGGGAVAVVVGRAGAAFGKSLPRPGASPGRLGGQGVCAYVTSLGSPQAGTGLTLIYCHADPHFTSSIEFTHNTSKLNDEETLTYTLTELDYIEKDLWKVYHKNNPLKNN
ncbi:hypothetical protein CIHG_10535 [Coccidioides immitis H538.4]|uniref:Uncharacterized protein n=1 Tax=Coccidioides immitis H538.4 TaxID=396776 RepID=A0A0J8S5M8_COCIT|nr:hypothetical protein CIHG_10535 [Coccidioides immitis H538.4]